MSNTKELIELEDVVVKFAGDSGDGMQLVGSLFANSVAILGNDIVTFPDFPAEIRAPHNTVAGVSGFQVHYSKEKIYSIGDQCDLLVAMNPASLKINLKWLKPGGTIIVNSDTFVDKALEKCNYSTNPIEDGSLSGYNVYAVQMTTLTKKAIEKLNLDLKTADKIKNMFALGMVLEIFNVDPNYVLKTFESKFKSKQDILEANKLALYAGMNYVEITEVIPSKYFVPRAKLEKGKYRTVNGDTAVAWGLIAASEKSGRPLYLGSYPITPATEILMELAKHKSLGVKVLQAEDEIAGICSAIGASFVGSLAVTTTSGPGFSLKSEALGLAVMVELPLVVVDVQRGGPSTGLPTKSEQSDLLQALFGRNGECPLVVIAASTPADCFYKGYEAAKIAMEHITPVVLLMEGIIGHGSELFKIPDVSKLPDIIPPIAEANEPNYKPYRRDKETLVRKWALPGTEGLRHRIGGLEKENIFGNVTTDPKNHEEMVRLRQEKVNLVAKRLPEQSVMGEKEGDLLVVTWGSTYGVTQSVVKMLQEEGARISHAHFSYIMPLPLNTKEIFKGFKKIIVCELNSGQFAGYLRMMCPEYKYLQYNKVQCLPFTMKELKEVFIKIMEE